MSEDLDWEKVWKFRFSDERHPDWPPSIRAISINGLNLLGINEKTGKLYWNGDEIVTKSVVRLGGLERVLAAAAAIGTFGVFVVEVGRSTGWWS